MGPSTLKGAGVESDTGARFDGVKQDPLRRPTEPLAGVEGTVGIDRKSAESPEPFFMEPLHISKIFIAMELDSGHLRSAGCGQNLVEGLIAKHSDRFNTLGNKASEVGGNFCRDCAGTAWRKDKADGVSAGFDGGGNGFGILQTANLYVQGCHQFRLPVWVRWLTVS
jgi:hypothetical protein